MPVAPPSAISLANPIRDLSAVTYPEGIQSPDPKLNQGKKDGLFRYDRDFLMQFMQHCKEKPENLDLNLIGLEKKLAAEKQAYIRQISMSRIGSRRGGQVDPNGVVAGNGPSRRPSKAGDLSNFGRISKAFPSTALSFGPSSVFAGKKGEIKRESVSRTSSISNMFSMLSQGAEPAAEPKAPEPQRKRLVFQSRSKPTLDDAAANSESVVAESEAEPSAVEMTEKQALKKIGEDSKEFFVVRNLDEAEVYFSGLPAAHHFRLVEKFTYHVIESRAADVLILSQFFARAAEKELCTADAFEAGFMPIVELIDDITIDVPKALFAMVVKSAALSDDSKARLVAKSINREKLLAALLS
ncbi:hypothetical protein H0H92_007652 [Tricholoma furcatifolium]|nr:hypothetical protein H0H92_007652 [Tricholoma furcatifolium]